jgi:hypothetical protein
MSSSVEPYLNTYYFSEIFMCQLRPTQGSYVGRRVVIKIDDSPLDGNTIASVVGVRTGGGRGWEFY